MNTGLIVFLFLVVTIKEMQVPEFSNAADPITLVNVLLLALIPLGNWLSNKRMEAIDARDPFRRKFELFQLAMFIRWGIIEGVALFSLVGFMLLQDAKHLVLFLLCILAFAMASVSKERLINGAKLNAEEARALDE